MAKFVIILAALACLAVVSRAQDAQDAYPAEDAGADDSGRDEGAGETGRNPRFLSGLSDRLSNLGSRLADSDRPILSAIANRLSDRLSGSSSLLSNLFGN